MKRPLALYDLAMKCRDSSYEFFGDNEEYLQGRNLVEAGGTIHDSVKNVILSAIEGDGLDMKLVSPIAKDA